MKSRGHSINRARTALAIGVLAMPAVAIAATYVVWNPVLDGNLAFHWDARGRVDGFIAALPVFTISLAIATVAAVVGALLLLVPRLSSAARRDVLVWTGSASGVAMAFWLVPAGLTYAAGSARQAELGGWGALLAAFFFYGVLIKYALPLDGDRDAPSAPTAALQESELTRWSATVGSPLIAGVGIVAVASIAVATFLDPAEDEWVGVVVGVTGVAVVLLVGALAAVQVSIDSRGLTIRSALVRIPFTIIPLANIHAVRVDTVRAMEWGGWGWRRKGSDTAYIMRGSAALAVERVNGTTLFVTLPDPSEPASVLHTLAQRAT